jgi:hypothetical protein
MEKLKAYELINDYCKLFYTISSIRKEKVDNFIKLLIDDENVNFKFMSLIDYNSLTVTQKDGFLFLYFDSWDRDLKIGAIHDLLTLKICLDLIFSNRWKATIRNLKFRPRRINPQMSLDLI